MVPLWWWKIEPQTFMFRLHCEARCHGRDSQIDDKSVTGRIHFQSVFPCQSFWHRLSFLTPELWSWASTRWHEGSPSSLRSCLGQGLFVLQVTIMGERILRKQRICVCPSPCPHSAESICQTDDKLGRCVAGDSRMCILCLFHHKEFKTDSNLAHFTWGVFFLLRIWAKTQTFPLPNTLSHTSQTGNFQLILHINIKVYIKSSWSSFTIYTNYQK